VAGALDPDQERRLRGHLARCAPCRRHYDEVSAAAEALGSPAGPRRERTRLLAALSAPGEVHRRRPSLRWLAPAALAAAAGVALLVGPLRREPPRVAFRGASTGDTAPFARLLLHASRKGERPGPLRLVADLPGAGEARLSLGDYLQLATTGATAPAFVTVVGLDETGGVHQYVPRPGATPVPVAAGGARGLGPSIDLAAGHRPGRLRLFALFSAAPLDETLVRAAAARAGLGGTTLVLDGLLGQVSGLVILEP
jgi:hypothetical protein